MSESGVVPGSRLHRRTQDPLLARRDFLRLLTALSGGLALTTGAVAAGVFRRGSPAGHATKRIVSSLGPGESVTFAYPGPDDPAIAVGLADGTPVAFSSVCPHLGCAVLWKKESGRLECPCHDGAFDVRSGRVLAGPPPRPLTRIRLEHRADGIYATGVPQ
jgi:Rieske Fe-S protein